MKRLSLSLFLFLSLFLTPLAVFPQGGMAPGPGTAHSTVQSEVATFITCSGITDPTQITAVDQLVTDFKAAGIWTKMTAVYPFVGGTAATHKCNLKDARDLDAAFRIVWNGGVTHNANGITGNGTTGYGDTKLVASTNTTLNDLHVSVYCRTVGGSADNMYEVGVFDSTAAAIHLTLKNQGATGPTIGMSYRNDTGNAWVTKTDASAQGFWIMSRRASNDFEGYKNGVSFQTQTNTNTGTRPTHNFYILAINDTGNGTPDAGGFFSNRNLAFVSIGTSLTDADATAMYTAVQAFETTLGRQV
jgi:hypothetical protein